MSLILSDQLPAFERLKSQDVPVVSHQEAEHQEIRPLNIGFLNLMPSQVFSGTEEQWFRLLGRTPLQINPILVDFDDQAVRTTRGEGRRYLDDHYQKASEVQSHGLDGLIVTGANIGNRSIEEISYINPLRDLMDWARDNVTSTIYSCWAGHLAAKHFWDIEKETHREKVFGVFDHVVRDWKHPLCRSLDDTFSVVHSRYGNLPLEAVADHSELSILVESTSDAVGAHVIADEGARTVLFQGHPEYDRRDLHNEYIRDAESGMALPKSYYQSVKPDPDTIIMNWRSNAQTLINNWVNYVYKTTGFDPLQPTMEESPQNT